MKVRQIRFFQNQRPFEPFAVHLADARYFEIRHPDAVFVLPDDDRTVSIMNKDGLIEVVDLLMITSLRPLNAKEIKIR